VALASFILAIRPSNPWRCGDKLETAQNLLKNSGLAFARIVCRVELLV
jgi:hypothetical protein